MVVSTRTTSGLDPCSGDGREDAMFGSSRPRAEVELKENYSIKIKLTRL